MAKVDQFADGGPTDVDGRPLGNLGAWEASGIVELRFRPQRAPYGTDAVKKA